MRHNNQPIPEDHKEIARGSGPSAILLFTHIAVTGYLGYIIFFLLRHNDAAFGNLVRFSAALTLYFPAAFAVFTYMPTDSLTKIVGRVALGFGFAAWLVYCAGFIVYVMDVQSLAGRDILVLSCAIMAGITGGLLARVVFALGIKRG